MTALADWECSHTGLGRVCPLLPALAGESWRKQAPFTASASLQVYCVRVRRDALQYSSCCVVLKYERVLSFSTA